jgi:hypothetical protein
MSIISDIEQAGANLITGIKQWIMPTPQWILTPEAEEKLAKAGLLQEQKDFFAKTVKETNQAYSSILPNVIGQMTNGVAIAIVIGLILLIILVVKK